MARPQSELQTAPLREIYTVSRLNLEARQALESTFPPIWVEGELSNLARPRSGHLYFSLKDEHCQVRCAMFRMHNRHLDFDLNNGTQVLAQVRVGLYPERGEFQLIVQYLEEAGTGALRRAFDALKHRLAGEGLFDQQRKREVPALAQRVGIVTSPTGAAVQDVLTVLKRRSPGVKAIVYPVPVQGPSAAGQIARMLDIACARDECDVLILTRGGGSLEDLWCFNEEVVARAIDRCTIPLVTGVGHEVDVTIADFVADRRAPTPSAAAELVSPDAVRWRESLEEASRRLHRQMQRYLHGGREQLNWLRRSLVHPRRLVQDLSQRLDALQARATWAVLSAPNARRTALRALEARLYRHAPETLLRAGQLRAGELSRRLHVAMRQDLSARASQVRGLERALTTLGPQQTLERGYAILTRQSDGRVLRQAADAPAGARIEARLARGRLRGQVHEALDDD